MTSAPDRTDRPPPHPASEMADMFDRVVPRYDLLNRLMTLGQDAVWRRAMWRAVPERAHTVLDLCTGNGASLGGLRRPGRLLVGLDVSLAMLEQAVAEHGRLGWAPRLLCGDAFHLPLRSRSLDAITIAFGVRNLSPRGAALAEMARVLRPGGVLCVLEALAPRAGPLAGLHRFHLRRVLPLLGKLSPDPAAYRYLGESILEFGSGPEFERALSAAGFTVERRRAFLLGAAGLWIARARQGAGEKATAGEIPVQHARGEAAASGDLPHDRAPVEAESRWWSAIQLLISAALLAALIVVLRIFFNSSDRLPLEPGARTAAALLLMGGTIWSAVRTALLVRRLLTPPARR